MPNGKTRNSASVRLSPGESAFMESLLKEVGGFPEDPIIAGISFSYESWEGRAVGGLARKGMLDRSERDVTLTEQGAQWLREHAGKARLEETPMATDALLFKEPSGGIRGVVTTMMSVGKKETRIAHAYLHTDGSVDIALSVPRSMTGTAQVGELLALLAEFKEVVEQHSADHAKENVS